MKRMKLISAIVLLLFVVGCERVVSQTNLSSTVKQTSNTSIESSYLEQLSTPENVKYETVLSWSEVEHATSYDIYINGDVTNQTDNTYIFDEEGDYTVSIVAKAPGYLDSEHSEEINIQIDYQNNVDFSLTYENDMLQWNAVEDAIGYHVFINDNLYDTNTNSFNLHDIESGVLRVKVQAVYPIGVTNISDELLVEHNLIITDNMYFQYSIYSTMNVIIWDVLSTDSFYLQNSDSEFIDKDEFLNLENEHPEIKSSYLTNFSVGTFTFYLIYDSFKTAVEVTVTNNTNPYIISSTIINTSGHDDVYLQYELFGGSFYSVNGSRDDTVLYHSDSNILVIEKEFITQKFMDSDSFVLSYVINKDENSVIGYLFFYLLEK